MNAKIFHGTTKIFFKMYISYIILCVDRRKIKSVKREKVLKNVKTMSLNIYVIKTNKRSINLLHSKGKIEDFHLCVWYSSSEKTSVPLRIIAGCAKMNQQPPEHIKEQQMHAWDNENSVRWPWHSLPLFSLKHLLITLLST